MDLEIFEKKFKLAKEASSDLKGALRRMGDRDFEEEIKAAEKALYEAEKTLILKTAECRNLGEEADALRLEISKLDEKISSAPSEPINIKKVKRDLASLREQLKTAEALVVSNDEEVRQNKGLIKKMKEFLNNFNIEDLNQKEKQFSILLRQISNLEDRITHVNKKKELLTKVPCGDSFPSCMFIKDAVDGVGEEKALLDDLA